MTKESRWSFALLALGAVCSACNGSEEADGVGVRTEAVGVDLAAEQPPGPPKLAFEACAGSS